MSTAESTRKVPDARRRLVLIRHAKSDYPEGVADHERPLNRRGRREAPGVGDWLMAHVGVAAPPLVIVSTATRTQQTWRLIRERLSGAWAEAEQVDEARIYEADVPDLLEVMREVPDERMDVVLIGHAPGLPGLVAACARPGEFTSQALSAFPTSTVAVLETDRGWAADTGASMTMRAFAVVRDRH